MIGGKACSVLVFLKEHFSLLAILKARQTARQRTLLPLDIHVNNATRVFFTLL